MVQGNVAGYVPSFLKKCKLCNPQKTKNTLMVKYKRAMNLNVALFGSKGQGLDVIC